jgi:regulatory protein
MNDPLKPTALNSHEAHLKRARNYLSTQLGRKPRTITETKRLLVRKEYSQEVIDSAIQDAIERGWLDDKSYSKLWIEHRSSTNPRGDYALKRELMAKGVSKEIIESALSDSDQSEDSLIAKVVERKMLSLQHQDPSVRKAKLIGHLKRRGFSFDAIRNALEEVGL